MLQYHTLMERILEEGEDLETRNGYRRTIYGHQMSFNLTNGFPAVTTKVLFFEKVVWELIWFLEGRTDLAFLHAHDVHIWDQNARGDYAGPIYGEQWRSFGGDKMFDQIKYAIRLLHDEPTSTRNVVSAWNPEAAWLKSYLPPCHTLFQVHSNGKRLSLQVYMRSVDVALGLPFNIASYALLAHLLAIVSGQAPHRLIFSLGNAHLYRQHVGKARMQLTRQPYPLPTLEITGPVSPDLRGLDASQFKLINYQYHPYINYELIP